MGRAGAVALSGGRSAAGKGEALGQPDDRQLQDVILNSIADGVFTVDHDSRITSFNRAAERITGVSRDEAIGRPCCEVFRTNLCEAGCGLRETIAQGRPIVNRAMTILNSENREVPISISTALLTDAAGEVIGGV